MMIEVDFDFLVKHKMTIEQYMLCYVLVEDQKSIKNGERIPLKKGAPVASIYKYTENVKPMNTKEMEDLIERGYIRKLGEKLVPDLLEVTSKFTEEVFNHWTNFQQLFDIYPSSMRLGPGQPKVSLKSLDKPIEEIGRYYTSIVKTKKKHKEILEITEWAKNQGLIQMGIQKYVYSKYWNQLSEDFNYDTSDDGIETLI